MPSLTGLPALDTAIGLVLLFFLLSTVCSALNEALANVLGWRAKTLEDGVRNLLGDKDVRRGWKEWIGRLHKRVPATTAQPRSIERDVVAAADGPAVELPADLTSALFAHPRLSALVRDASSSVRRRARPSYLPPRTFSLALAERLAQGAPADDGGPSLWQLGDQQLFQRVQTVLDHSRKAKPGSCCSAPRRTPTARSTGSAGISSGRSTTSWNARRGGTSARSNSCSPCWRS